MNDLPSLEELRRGVRQSGLAWRGAFRPEPGDAVPACADGSPARTVVLLGVVGGEQWPAFAASAELADGAPQPLDRWSRRLVDALGARYRATALYPSDGPPWWPFQRWAMQAEAVHASPLGILIHPDWGLWHAYRGALAWPDEIVLPPRDLRPSPCASCRERLCERTCPVVAITPAGYDAGACVAHVASERGSHCLRQGCQARRACPVGADYRYGAEQAEFHMRAFLGRR